MDFDDIRQFISADGERVILVEDGKPTIVLMSFDSYKKRFKFKEEEKKNISKEGDEALASSSATRAIAKGGKERMFFDSSRQRRDSVEDELKVEDLPF
jgi:PHD/YefM family antitoxin component YafN of YafNO toxin-antitoxin module